jgi:hypothetical protein
MAALSRNSEASHKKPSVKSSVESLIERKKAEKQSQIAESAAQKMAGTKEGVAEVMGGMEKPSEKISEKKGESGEKGDIKGGGGSGGTTDDSQFAGVTIKDYVFPSEVVMVKKIRTAINAQIKLEWKKAQRMSRDLDKGGADGYNKSIARIRHMKEMMFSLFNMTVGFLKNMYVKYFTPDGKRREIEDIQ